MDRYHANNTTWFFEVDKFVPKIETSHYRGSFPVSVDGDVVKILGLIQDYARPYTLLSTTFRAGTKFLVGSIDTSRPAKTVDTWIIRTSLG
jgi:hypothetical protein